MFIKRTVRSTAGGKADEIRHGYGRGVRYYTVIVKSIDARAAPPQHGPDCGGAAQQVACRDGKERGTVGYGRVEILLITVGNSRLLKMLTENCLRSRFGTVGSRYDMLRYTVIFLVAYIALVDTVVDELDRGGLAQIKDQTTKIKA